jgi:hypothetical protein
MPRPFNIDADPDDADWPKRTWDLTHSEEQDYRFAQSILNDWPMAEVEAFSQLVAFRAAPAVVRDAVEERLAHHD